MTDTFPITFDNSVPLPANSGHSYLLDTTCWNDRPWVIGAASGVPGKSRGQLAGKRVTGTITPTGQTITVTFELLTNPSGTTSAAWEADANIGTSGAFTVASTVTQPFSWLPPTTDYRIRVTAGATAPTAIKSTCVVVTARTSGT